VRCRRLARRWQVVARRQRACPWVRRRAILSRFGSPKQLAHPDCALRRLGAGSAHGHGSRTSAQLDTDVGRELRAWQLHRYEGRRGGTQLSRASTRSPSVAPRSAATTQRCARLALTPLAMANCSDGHAGLTAQRDDLRPELGAVRAVAPAAVADLVGDSVHVSTENLGGHELPHRSSGIKMEWLAAYGKATLIKATLCAMSVNAQKRSTPSTSIRMRGGHRDVLHSKR
jgi:hypothetical protein